MAQGAPKGNNFWEIRSKHGRDPLFSDPKLMWEAAVEYFQWCIDNPLIEIDFRGKDAEKVELPKMRAFTIHGLTSYLECNVGYFNDFEAALKNKPGALAKDFSLVIARIKETIYNQKFTGAAAGFLNPNIIARDLGLSDKQEIKQTTTTTTVDMTQLSEEALNEIANAANDQSGSSEG